MHSQDKILVRLVQECFIKKINLVVTSTGAIINENNYTSLPKYKAVYVKGKVKIYEKDKLLETVDFKKPESKEDTKTNKKKSSNDKNI